MGIAAKNFAVFLAGATGIWKGVPVGIALQLHPLYNGLFTAMGCITTVLVLFYSGESLKQRVIKLYGEKRIEKKKTRLAHLANRYGKWGIGVISTGIIGPFPSLLIGLIVYKNARGFLVYLLIGITLWSFALAYLFTPFYRLIEKAVVNP